MDKFRDDLLTVEKKKTLPFYLEIQVQLNRQL